ncbi:MAG: hypothetical protein SPJ83_10520 [Helicobacter sp.]|uniref:hypothetical protein n=1 Tax=Helicobacter sp. TaxID=218 RepID=UPI002A90C45E|nr:hypothetical protein [Helicobacter sp.]MDY5823199.1 hypothetical protein [Helicobacter sp.]
MKQVISVNTYKKLGLSFVLVGALGVSANAICASENYCTDFYIGAGGYYEKIEGNGANINNALGFLSLGGADIFFNRVQFGLDAKIGYGSNSVSGTSLSTLSKDNRLFQIDGIAKLGVNVAGVNSPLFINFLLGYDMAKTNGGVGRDFMIIGAGFDGKIALSEKMKLIYSAGYGYVFNGAYSFGKAYADINEKSHVIMFSLGTQAKVSEHVSLYFKGFGKYYNLNASNTANNVSMPKSSGWQAGLEAGIAF